LGSISDTLNKGAGEGMAHSCTESPEALTYASYDDSFSIFSYACASQFYDAFFFYHTAYLIIIWLLKYVCERGE
jgi:hypothetical protein